MHETIERLRTFIDTAILPFSNEWEEREAIPDDLLADFAKQGYFGAFMPAEWGGMELDNLRFGECCAEIARGSVSLLSMLTVHNMTAQAILRWGSNDQKKRWLPALASGEKRAAFALTEPSIGSDASNIATSVMHDGDNFRLNGAKKWISFSTKADVFLVIARCEEHGPTAFLLERGTPGFEITPMKGLLGFRAAGVSELTFDNCRIGTDSLLGISGGGFSYVAGHSLDHGRYCVGWGCTGLIGACLDASVSYARERTQFDRPLRSNQLIQAMIADMSTDYTASRALAEKAAASRENIEPESIMLTTTLKYFSSKAALKAASDAVQIHGGNGCGSDYPVQRYLRDAKICEIIEGSSQMQQLMIARDTFSSAARRNRKRRRKS